MATRKSMKPSTPAKSRVKRGRKQSRPARGTATGTAPKGDRAAPILGNIYECKLTDGRLAYFQYVGVDLRPPPGFSGYGYLIRVLPAIQKTRPADPAALALQEGEQFLMFTHLPSAVRQKAAALVGHSPVPKRLKRLPLFKDSLDIPDSPLRRWFLVDIPSGKRSRSLGEYLPRDMIDYPYALLSNMPAVAELVETGWTHRTWVRPQDIMPVTRTRRGRAK